MLIGKQVERMVEQALKEQAPGLWQSLTDQGTLAAFLEEKAEEMYALQQELENPEYFKILQSNLGPLERQQQATEATRRAWEQVLQTCLTFPEETTTASRSAG